MTPPDWASQRVSKLQKHGDYFDGLYVKEVDIARLLRLEHARAVKAVKDDIERLEKVAKAAAYRENWPLWDGLENQLCALRRTLDALQRGRTVGKGKR